MTANRMPRGRASASAAALLLLVSLAASAAPGKGDLPPDYAGTTLGGETVSLAAYAGKAVVVSFWATWCGYCLKELPVLNGIQNAGKDGIRVIAVNTEERDVFRKVTRALKSLDLKLAYDPGEKAQKAYGVNGIPHMVIIGRDGKIAAVYRGYDESQLESIVADLNRAIGAVRQAQ